MVTACSCLLNLVLTGTWQVLGPELTRQVSGEATWGFVLSARGAGLLLMSVLLYRLAVRRLLALGQLLSVLVALPLLAIGAQAVAPWLIVTGFASGLGMAAAGISWDTSLQEHVPSHVLSRVASYDDLLSYLAIPIGQLSVGPLAQTFGGFPVITVAGVLTVAVALLPLASRAVRRLPHTAVS